MSDTLVAIRTFAGETVVRTGASVLVLVAANAGVLFLFLAYDLEISQLLVLYWWESLIIGLFCAAKMLTALIAGKPYRNSTAGLSRGVVLLISTAMLFLVVAAATMLSALLGLAIAPFVERLGHAGITAAVSGRMGLALGLFGMLVVGHAFSFLVNFLALGEYRSARPRTLIALPIVRSLALAAAIALSYVGALLVPQAIATWGFVIVIVSAKMALDYRLHLRERRALNVL